MNLNAHILRLQQIAAKLERGETPTEREIAYVRMLWERIRPVVKKLVGEIEQAFGATISEVAQTIEGWANKRRRAVIAERDAARKAMVRMQMRRKT